MHRLDSSVGPSSRMADPLECDPFLDALFSDVQSLDEASGGSLLGNFDLFADAPASLDSDKAAKMRQWQAEASRLWDSRVKIVASTSRATPKINSWQRRKLELQELRGQVKALEGERIRLQTRRAERRFVMPRDHEHRRYSAIAWHARATRERRLLQESRAENARLKDLVHRHVELSQNLQPALVSILASDLPRQARLDARVELSSVFGILERKLDDRAPHIDKLLRERQAREGHSIKVNSENGPHPVGTFQSTRMLPFRVLTVSDALWRCAQVGFREFSFSSGSVISSLCSNMRSSAVSLEVWCSHRSRCCPPMLSAWICTSDCQVSRLGAWSSTSAGYSSDRWTRSTA